MDVTNLSINRDYGYQEMKQKTTREKATDRHNISYVGYSTKTIKI